MRKIVQSMFAVTRNCGRLVVILFVVFINHLFERRHNLERAFCQVLKEELATMRQFVAVHVSDHSGFHYRQFLFNCMAAIRREYDVNINDWHRMHLQDELQLTDELNDSYPGHEAVWYHRSGNLFDSEVLF